MADHTRSSTILFNNQWMLVSMTTTKTKLPSFSKQSPSTNMEVASSLQMISPNQMEIAHHITLNGWVVSTTTVLQGITTAASAAVAALADSNSESIMKPHMASALPTKIEQQQDISIEQSLSKQNETRKDSTQFLQEIIDDMTQAIDEHTDLKKKQNEKFNMEVEGLLPPAPLPIKIQPVVATVDPTVSAASFLSSGLLLKGSENLRRRESTSTESISALEEPTIIQQETPSVLVKQTSTPSSVPAVTVSAGTADCSSAIDSTGISQSSASAGVSSQESEGSTVVSKFNRKRKQHSSTFLCSSTVMTSPFKRMNSSSSEEDDEIEDEFDSSSLPIIKRGIQKLRKNHSSHNKLIVSSPNLSTTSNSTATTTLNATLGASASSAASAAIKRDRKNIVKNFIKAFRGFMSSPADEREVLDVLNSSLQKSLTMVEENAAMNELTRIRSSLERFLENKNFNNSLMVQLISNSDFTILLHHFLSEKAPEWIQLSKIKDKLSHEEALNHYLLSLKDSSALQKVRCLKYRGNSQSMSASVLPDILESNPLVGTIAALNSVENR